jgi:hypothetical protein
MKAQDGAVITDCMPMAVVTPEICKGERPVMLELPHNEANEIQYLQVRATAAGSWNRRLRRRTAGKLIASYAR